MGMLFASARAVADDDVQFLSGTTSHEFQRERRADRFTVKLRVDVFESCDGAASEGDENVSNDDAGFVRWAFRLDFENDGRGFFAALQGLAESVGQTHGLQSHAEITLRDMAFLQKGVDDAIEGRRGNGDGAEAREAGRSDADDAALCVDDGAADGGGLQRDVEANVRCEGCAGPGAALRSDEADYAKRGDRPAGPRAAYDEREVAGLQGSNIAESCDCACGFRTFQDGEIG